MQRVKTITEKLIKYSISKKFIIIDILQQTIIKQIRFNIIFSKSMQFMFNNLSLKQSIFENT